MGEYSLDRQCKVLRQREWPRVQRSISTKRGNQPDISGVCNKTHEAPDGAITNPDRPTVGAMPSNDTPLVVESGNELPAKNGGLNYRFHYENEGPSARQTYI